MCSVVGYVGKNLSRSFVMEGLTRLEYRGYDSAGFVCVHPENKRLMYAKSQGGINHLKGNFERSPIDGFIGMGHTRWSTHGVATTENAHPHFDCMKSISVVHNGIIENHHELKQELLQQGHIFHSSTDTEIIAHLLESLLPHYCSFVEAVVALVNKLEGAYAFTLLSEQYPDMMLIVRKRSPLCIGSGEDEVFIASDVLAFSGHTNKVFFLPDESFALIRKNEIELYNFQGARLPLDFQVIAIPAVIDAKQGFEHFMLKEIYEQKKVIQDTVYKWQLSADTLWSDIGIYKKETLAKISDIHLIGCGTSFFASHIGHFYFERIAGIQTFFHLASEMRFKPFFEHKHSLAFALSQSGETADTLESVRFLRNRQVHTAAITNVSSSTITRESDGYVLMYAGPEIAVASTKAFSAQLATLYLLAHHLAAERGTINTIQLKLAYEHLLMVAEILESNIEKYKNLIINTLAPRYAHAKQMIFIGRHISYPCALEAALKLKEIPYIFADCYPAGELKHGPLALIDEHTPVFIFSSPDPVVYQKLKSNAQEIKARSGHIITIAFEGQQELIDLADCALVIPPVPELLSPLAMIGLAQFFIYEVARVLKRPIDKPRNLAKSVTVE